MKLKNLVMKDNQFINALRKLSNAPMRDPKVAYNIAKLVRKLEVESKTLQECFIKLLKEYAILDDKGGFVPVSEDQPGSFQIPTEKQEEFGKKHEEFQNIEFEVACAQIKLSDTGGVLTAQDMIALEAILDTEE